MAQDAMTSCQPDARPADFPAIVLLVEDNPMIAMNCEMLLLDMGVDTVHVAGSVAEAMALLDTVRFDLVLLDRRLREDEDSLPVAERLLAEGVLTVFATGLGDQPALQPPYDALPRLRKPYGADELENLIASLRP